MDNAVPAGGGGEMLDKFSIEFEEQFHVERLLNQPEVVCSWKNKSVKLWLSDDNSLFNISDACLCREANPNWPLANIVLWRWARELNVGPRIIAQSWINEHGYQYTGGTQDGPWDYWIVVRFVKKRTCNFEKPLFCVENYALFGFCKPLAFVANDPICVLVGAENGAEQNGGAGVEGAKQFTVSGHALMVLSPVFHRMLTNELREKRERKLRIPDASPEDFVAFLAACSPHQPLSPNPSNVMALFELADRFQVGHLKDRCEAQLANCAEIPLLERVRLADLYRMDKLTRALLSQMDDDWLRIFNKDNRLEINKFNGGTKRIIAEMLVDTPRDEQFHEFCMATREQLFSRLDLNIDILKLLAKGGPNELVALAEILFESMDGAQLRDFFKYNGKLVGGLSMETRRKLAQLILERSDEEQWYNFHLANGNFLANLGNA